MRSLLAGGLGISLVLLGALSQAEEYQWRPAAHQVRGASSSPVSLGNPVPIVTLGRPIGAGNDGARSERETITDPGIAKVSFSQTVLFPPQPIVRAQGPDPGGPTLAPPPGSPIIPSNPSEGYNCGVVTAPPAQDNSFWGKCRHLFDGLTFGGGTSGHTTFESDHAFDDFASPVSNPFYFEDPRSLTEARPILMLQGTSSKNPVFHGGDIEYFGLQARLALTERLDLVLNKIGLDWIEPHSGIDGFQNHFGLSELWLGPKYTFIRNEQCGRLLAAGVTFEIPTGSAKVFQDTGTLSLEPYISFGQKFGFSSYGTFHFLDTTGYTFAVDNKRTDYFLDSIHLDYDVANLHKIYPLVELNYFHYTTAGKQRALNFEGRDLFNFGSTGVSGQNDLEIALGVRYKFSECIQTGLAVEIPLLGRHDLLDYRVTFDVIFRY